MLGCLSAFSANHLIAKDHHVSSPALSPLTLLVSLSLHAQTFRAAKQDLNRLYQDHPVTFYCGCKIDYQGKK